MARGIPILPFRIEDVPLSPSLEYCIGDIHWLDALTPPLEGHLEHLAGTVDILLSRSRIPPDIEGKQKAPMTGRVAVEAVDKEVHVEAPEPKLATPPAAGAVLATAPFGLRAGALVLDLLFAFIATAIVATLAAIPAMVNPCQDPDSLCVQDAGWFSTMWLVLPCYLWVSNAFGRSPGKWMLRLAVIRNPRRQIGALSVQEVKPLPPGWGLGLARTVVSLASLLALGLGCFWALRDSERRTWHDLAADTLVVRLE